MRKVDILSYIGTKRVFNFNYGHGIFLVENLCSGECGYRQAYLCVGQCGVYHLQLAQVTLD
jgi:hypothetical protein